MAQHLYKIRGTWTTAREIAWATLQPQGRRAHSTLPHGSRALPATA
ncbi:MAG: hypothetical protein IPJ50_16500 [Betaproteobacteria bacterium]|nr:hypothetical protein [Betaproteobacteria bacterium]